MWLKRILLSIIVAGVYIHIMVNNPAEPLKSLGYKSMLGYYASQIDYSANIRLVHDPGLRKLSFPKEKAHICAVLPEDEGSFVQIADQLLETDDFAVIQCSGMDCWHTSQEGRIYLHKIYNRGYRVVVFDGGHHLPTLGLRPDIILVPQMSGYLVHSYMKDGMRINKLLQIAQEICSPSVIAVIPRWALVKQKDALTGAVREIFDRSSYRQEPAGDVIMMADKRMSKFNNRIFIYVNEEYYKDAGLLISRIKKLGAQDVQKIYLAFDYKSINKGQSQDFAEFLEEELSREIEIVNEPVNVFNVFWEGNGVLQKQLHSFKSY